MHISIIRYTHTQKDIYCIYLPLTSFFYPFLSIPTALSISLSIHLLTWDGDSKLVRLEGQKPSPQLVVAAVRGSDQGDGAFTIGWLVIEGHLLVGQDVVVV